MNLKLSFLVFGIFVSLSEVAGTVTMQVPIAGNCGDDTVLTCQVTGSIGDTAWFGLARLLVTNGSVVRPEDNNKYTGTRRISSFTLTIHNTDITDEDSFACRNGFDYSINNLTIECKASSSSHSVTRGKKLQITVDKLYPASPTLTATFKRQNSTIQISGSTACSRSTQYTGYYRCVWTSSNSLYDGSYTYNIVVTTITQAAPLTGSLKIASPKSPLISNVIQLNTTREVVYGNEGQSLTIRCTSVGGYPSPTVTWYKNNISSSNQLASTSSGTLQSEGTYTVNLQHTFTPAASDDRKYLICRSYYPQADSAEVGSNSKSVILHLILEPSQPTVTQTSVVSAGSTVTVRCITSGCRPAATISWLYQGVTYSGSTTNTSDAATETFTVNSVYTRQVTAVDNGQSIQCIVTHPALVSPAQLTKSTHLNIQFSVGPSTTQITGNREIVATGSTPLTLTCTTGSSNPASDITWRNGSHILESNHSYTTSTGVNNGVVRSQQLVLYPTRYMDGDDITCSVSNSVSQSPVIDKIKLNLKYRPLIKPMSEVIVVEGNSTELICAASSKPASKFKWYKQGQSNVLHNGTGTMENNKLSYPLTNVRRGDAATYTCNANNGIENADNKNVLLTVYYIPAVPIELYYIGRYTGVDMFIFHGGFNGGLLQTFVIKTRIKETTVWTEQLRFNETDVRYLQNEQMLYRFDIKGLPPGVYNIRVLAGNNAGWIATDLAPMIEFTVYELEEEQSQQQQQQQQSDHKAAIVGGSLSFVIVGILVAGVFIFRKMTCKNAEKKSSENTVSSTYDSLHTQPEAGTTYSTLTVETGSERVPQDKMYENLQTQYTHDTSQML